ncbi:MAG: SpoIIIAH-like family protein [Clostridia bacterium]|nr:SpoIIIAH-like family protein [Clostridia bacterium]
MAKWKLFGEGGFFSKIGKRNLPVICAVILIGGAVCVNYFLFFGKPGDDAGVKNADAGQTDTGAQTSANDTYFASALLSRQQARDEALEVLQTVVASNDALESTKDKALTDISRIALEIENESNIEALVRAKGFEKCVAVIGGDGASIIVKSDEELLSSQVAQINEIVYTQTGILPANVKILRKN